jgi:predicted permease
VATWLEDAWKDVRFAIRQLRKSPGFTAVAVVSLAIGIGVNAAIFTLIDALLLKRLPVRDPATLVLLGDAHGSGVGIGQTGSYALFSNDLYHHLSRADFFDGLVAFQSEDDRISVSRDPWSPAQPAVAKLVSGNYFDVLGVRAAIGRALAPLDDAPSASPVAVVSFRYWRETLNEDPSAIGGTVTINGVPVEIVGIAPREFYGETIQPDPPSFWLPMEAARRLKPESNLLDEPDSHWLYLIGRLKSNVAAPQAEARLTRTLQNWLLDRAGSMPSSARRKAIADSRIELTPAAGGVPRMQRDYSRSLWLLFGISLAVILIACANIAGLLLARGMGRRVEHSLKVALGATRGRLLRQSLAENLTLAVAGGLAALLVAPWSVRLLLATIFHGVEYVPIHANPDARVIAFTFALSSIAAVTFGLLPAIRLHAQIGPALKRAPLRLGKALVVGEVTLSLVVLAGAAALAQSLVNLTNQHFGFERSHVLVANVDPGLARYSYDRLGSLYQQLGSRLQALPGVKSASYSYYSPFNGCCWAFSVTIPGYEPQPNERISAVLNRVSPRYFETLGTRMLQGRAFGERDTAVSPRVVIVNDAFVRRFFPGREPIGRTIHIDSEGRVGLEIVGVVESAKYEDAREQLRPMVFLPFFQMRPDASPTSSAYRSNFIGAIEVRTSGDPGALAQMVRQTVAAIDPAVPVFRVDTLTDHVQQVLVQERATAALAVVFGVMALVLTCIGLYGLMAYLVERRTSDIGIRMALGADRGAVVRMIVREALVQAFAGIVIGIPIAVAMMRLMASQLFGVSAADPRSATAAAAALTMCLAIAAYLPARRASLIDPIRALRTE